MRSALGTSLTRALPTFLALLALHFTSACEPEVVTATQISVTVDSELGSDLASLRVEIFDAEEARASDAETYDQPSLPFTFAVVPAVGSAAGLKVLVAIRGLDADGEVLAEAKALVQFVPQQKRGLEMVLHGGCRGKICPASQACSAASNFECAATMTAATQPLDATSDAGGSTIVAPALSADAGERDDDGSSEQTPPDGAQSEDSSLDATINTLMDGGAAVVRDSGQTSGSDAGPSDGGRSPVDAGSEAGSAHGRCCDGGSCLCRTPPPAPAVYSAGSHKFNTYVLPVGNVYYPVDAEPPLAALVLAPSQSDDGLGINITWGVSFASHGIVALSTRTPYEASPEMRTALLVAALRELKQEHLREGSPLQGKLSGRYGVFGLTAGAAAGLRVSGTDSTLKSAVGIGIDTTQNGGTFSPGGVVPTLLYCGLDDTIAPCSQHTDPAYAQIPATSAKMKVIVPNLTALEYNDILMPNTRVAALRVLAFHRLFLEGDERWRTLLLSAQTDATITTNIR